MTGRVMMFFLLPLLSAAAVVAIVLGLGDGEEFAAPGDSDVSCDRFVAPDDDLDGFARGLSPGETGCLREGEYVLTDGELKIESPGITLASAPGEQATLIGRIWVALGADGVTLSGLRLDGRNERAAPSPTINASRVRLVGNDISNGRTAICVSIGDGPGRPSGTVIEGNLIHDCGKLPRTNHHHGIYVADATGTVIRDNWIYDNADRGIQLYPNADDSLITGNVIDDNGEGIIFSGDEDDVSERNLVEGNLITNSEVRYNVESNWFEDRVGGGNLVRGNCIFGGARGDVGGGIQTPTEGFVAKDNRITDPGYVARDQDDYDLTPESDCRDLLR